MTPLHDSSRRDLASDNYAGAHPEIMAAIVSANEGHVVSYGDDPYTRRWEEIVRREFGSAAEAFPVFNGTGANVIALQAVLPRWGAAICADNAHITMSEAAAPEGSAGIKLLTVTNPDSKITPDDVERHARALGNVHSAQPLALSLTQATELGTLYTVEEMRALTDTAHRAGLAVHLDGARLANAAAALGLSLGAASGELGVDVLSFGGTKNGLLLGESIIVLDPARAPGTAFLRKRSMQLASKMRFLSAQFVALFETDGGRPLWERTAAHANAMAQRLRTGVDERLADGRVAGIRFTQPTETNQLFAVLDRDAADRLRETMGFYDWDADRGEVRWVCSFDLEDSDIDTFLAAIERTLPGAGR